MAEVRRLAVDRRRVPFAALPRERLDPVHLLQDRSLIFGLGLGQRVAQLDERARIVDVDAGLGLSAVQFAQHHVEELLLLADNRRWRRRVAVRVRFGR